MSNPHVTESIELMQSFAAHTGLSEESPARRYLWTDAFALCNLLGLARLTGEERYASLALHLVGQVHHILGRHRDDDSRTGWISGLNESEGEAHPTRGGLRIGKSLPERGPRDPFDEALEWERDGQYFHYLTKWMHALDQLTCATGDARFNVWARELAQTAQHAFTHRTAGVPAMCWKMSIDLSRPLVAAMGQHDALDGYVTCLQLRATAAAMPGAGSGGPELVEETRQFAALMEGVEWRTTDPLGLGGLLIDACRVEQLMRCDAMPDGRLLDALLAAALAGLQHYARGGELRLPAEHRLAFRELGLAIGLHALELMAEAARAPLNAEGQARLRALMQHAPLGRNIESFWCDPASRRSRSWNEHRDINEVMLATSLAPEGFLVLAAAGPA